jgi:hypothetical protein
MRIALDNILSSSTEFVIINTIILVIVTTAFQTGYTATEYNENPFAMSYNSINTPHANNSTIIDSLVGNNSSIDPQSGVGHSPGRMHFVNNATVNLSLNAGHSELPQIVTSEDNVYVVWVDDNSGNRDIFFRKSIDNGETFGSTINLSNNTGGSLDPNIAISGNHVYVVWEHTPESNGQIYFTRSTDNGHTFNKPLLIGNNTGILGLPQIATSTKSVYLVWRDANYGIMLRRSDDNGSNFYHSINLSNNTGYSFEPKVELSGSNVYVEWSEITFEGNSVYLRMSTDNGKTFGRINNLSDKAVLTHSPNIVTSGSTVNTIWSNDTFVGYNFPYLTDVIFRKSMDGGNTFNRTINLSNGTGFSFTPDIVVGLNGNNVYAVWEENTQAQKGEILFRKSTNGGNTFEGIVNLSNSERKNSTLPQVALSGNGSTVYVLWLEENDDSNTDGESNIYLRSSIDNGTTFGDIIKVSAAKMKPRTPTISADENNNNVYVAWSQNITGNEEIAFIGQSFGTSWTYNYNANVSWNNLPTTDLTKDTIKIAVVDPTFTHAAYDNSFYLFYNLYNSTFYDLYNDTTREVNITSHLNLLSSKLRDGTSASMPMLYLLKHLKWLLPHSNITLLTDPDVDSAAIFQINSSHHNMRYNGKDHNKYDIIILGHQEYVTQSEYNNLKEFVANGGILFLLDGNTFYAEVKYDRNKDVITLVKGHGWTFNGKSAWRSINETWAYENTQWIGSNFYQRCRPCDLIFDNNPFQYLPHEEQYITNPEAIKLLDYGALELVYRNESAQLEHNNTELLSYYKKIISDKNRSSSLLLQNNNNSFLAEYYNVLLLNYSNASNIRKVPIATYEMDYKKGKVIGMGIYSEDIISDYRFNRFFDSLILKYTKEITTSSSN